MNAFLKLSLAAAALMVGASTFYYFGFFLPQIQKQKMAEEVSTKRWELERQCSKDAETNFRGSSFSDANVSAGYDSHFNHRLNKCFMLVTKQTSQGKTMFTHKILVDVNAGTQSALVEYGKAVPWGTAEYQVKPFVCTMLENHCQTDEEFDAFVKPFIEE